MQARLSTFVVIKLHICATGIGTGWVFITVSVFVCRLGFRSIRLKNGYSEELELSTLLVHITIRNVNAEEEEAYGTMLDMKAEEMDIRRELNNAIQTKDNDKVQTLNKRLEDSKGQWRKFQTQMSG